MLTAGILLCLFAAAPKQPELVDPFTARPPTSATTPTAELADPFEAPTTMPKKPESSRGDLIDPFKPPVTLRQPKPRVFPGLRDPFQ